MNSWKERIAGKLSLLLGDTPSDLSGESSIVPPDTQARPLPKEGGHGFRRSLSSLFSSILPTASIDGYNRSNKHGCDIKPIQPLPTKWRCKNFPLDDEPPQDWDLEFVPVWEEDETHVAEDCPDNLENATISHIWVKIVPNLTDKSSFISSDLYLFLQPSLPNIVKGCQWALLYSTWKHGISLRTLLRKSFDLSGPCLLIVGDMQGAVFGGLLECPLRPTSTRKYQGTSQTFVFTTTYGEPRLFKATGANRYFYVCMNDLLALGGGGNFALCLDGDLLCGTSGPCETFGNLCLAHSQEFELKNVELWGFTHSSHYLT